MDGDAHAGLFDVRPDPSYNPEQWYDDLCDYFVMKKGALPAILSPRQSIKC